jgi:hypothetical protein
MAVSGRLILGGTLSIGAGLALNASTDNSVADDAGHALEATGAVAAMSGAGIALHRARMLNANFVVDDLLVGNSQKGQRTVGDAFAADTLRLEIAGTGPMSSRAVTWHFSEGAEHWLNGLAPSALSDALRGALSQVDALGDQVKLKNITIAFSAHGAAAASVRGAVDIQPFSKRREATRRIDHLWRAYHSGRIAEFDHVPEQITVGPDISSKLVGALRDGSDATSNLKAAVAIAHEIQHAAVSGNRSRQLQFTWVEEARADFISYAHVADTARAMKVPIRRKDIPVMQTWVGYPNFTSVLTKLGKLAGFSSNTASGRSHFIDFLQSRSETAVLSDLSERIAQRHGLDPNTLWHDVIQLDGSPTRMKTFLRNYGFTESGTRAGSRTASTAG